MYSSLFSFRHACRSSSLTSLLAGDHGHLTALRSLSALLVTYGPLESSGDNSKSFSYILRRKLSQHVRGPYGNSGLSSSIMHFQGNAFASYALSFHSSMHSDTRKDFLSRGNPMSTVRDISETDDRNSIGHPQYRTAVAILTHQRSKSRWAHLRSQHPNGFSPSEFSQIALHLKNNPHLALRFFLWTQRTSLCNHNVSSYSTLIHILARGRLKHQALILIRDAIRVSGLQNDKLEPDPLKVFETLVKTYRQCGSAPFVFDLLIEACINSKKIDSSIQITRMLLSRGISPRLITCSSLIQQVSKCRGANEGYKIYEEIFGSTFGGLKPSVEIFNTLMVGFYQDNILEKVGEIWELMLEMNCDPNCYSYSILMAVYCDEGKMDKAENLWDEMRAKNVELDVVAYNTMIGGFCGIGEVEKAEEFFREMGLSGIDSTAATYEHFVKGYCRVRNVDSAMLVYKDMSRKGFRLEGLTMEGLIRRICEKSRGLEALEILRGAKRQFGFCPTRKSFEFLVMGYCREGKMEEALKIQREMVSEGFEPSSEIYGAFINGYMEQGNVEMAEKLRMELLEIGV